MRVAGNQIARDAGRIFRPQYRQVGNRHRRQFSELLDLRGAVVLHFHLDGASALRADRRREPHGRAGDQRDRGADRQSLTHRPYPS